jgi:cysteine sulfinate desulfinase/cysteine desulfurase-like protein
VRIRPQSFGGGQERGRRAGTQDVCGALAFAAAARDCTEHLEERRAIVAERAQTLVDALSADESGIQGVAQNAKPVSVQYFTIDGRRVSGAQKGISIRKTVMDNGSVVVKKVRK